MEWKLSDSLHANYTEWFLQQSRGRDSVPICTFFLFMKSINVKERFFEKIWRLCINDPTVIRLLYSKFVIASFIADKVAHGALIPESLPEVLIQLEKTLICPVPRTCSESVEINELTGDNGMESATDIFSFIHSSFPPIRVAVWRTMYLVSLYPPNRKPVSYLITCDSLLQVIQSDLHAETKIHASLCLCSLTAWNPLWLHNLVCLTTTMVTKMDTPEISQFLLSSIANSTVDSSVFDKLFSSKTPYNKTLTYIDELIYFVNSKHMKPNIMEQLIRLFLNIESEKPKIEFIVHLFNSPNLCLLTNYGCLFLCQLIQQVWHLNQFFTIKQFFNLFTRVDRNALVHAAPALTQLLLAPNHSDDDLNERVSLMQLVFHSSLHESLIVDNCIKIVRASIVNATDQAGLLHVIQTACSNGPTSIDTVRLALECWKDSIGGSGASILGSLLRGEREDINKSVLEILANDHHLVESDEFKPYWSDLIECKTPSNSWAISLGFLAPYLDEHRTTELVMRLSKLNVGLDFINTLSIAVVRLVHVSSKNTHLVNQVMPLIIPYLSESYSACLACLHISVGDAVLTALSNPKTPICHIHVLVRNIDSASPRCVSELLNLILKFEIDMQVIEPCLNVITKCLIKTPGSASELIPSRLHVLCKIFQSGKFQNEIFAIFLITSLFGGIALVSNAIGVGTWFMTYALTPPVSPVKLGMIAMLVITQSRFRHICVPVCLQKGPFCEYLWLRIVYCTQQLIEKDILNRMWRRIMMIPDDSELREEIFELHVIILTNRGNFKYTSEGILFLWDRVHDYNPQSICILDLLISLAKEGARMNLPKKKIKQKKLQDLIFQLTTI